MDEIRAVLLDDGFAVSWTPAPREANQAESTCLACGAKMDASRDDTGCCAECADLVRADDFANLYVDIGGGD